MISEGMRAQFRAEYVQYSLFNVTTTAIKKQYLPSRVILGKTFGLKKPSLVMLEQLQTINQHELREYIGFVDNEEVTRRIAYGLKKALGMWTYKPREQSDVQCLCSRCLEGYKTVPDYICATA